MAKKSFLLRIDQDLWEEVNRWAEDDLRSVNGQITYILREATRLRKRKCRLPGTGQGPDHPDTSSEGTGGSSPPQALPEDVPSEGSDSPILRGRRAPLPRGSQGS